jgi:16S rRNA processing protein RimM
VKKRDAEELICIGKIGSSVGLRGEVRVTLYAQDSENLKEGKVLLLKHTGNTPAASAGLPKQLEAKCTGVRLQKDKPVIRLDGVTDRNMADELRGMEVFIHADQLEELPEGQHYVRDIVGYTVTDLASGREVGVLSDVIQNTAQSILDVRSPEGKQILIPAVDAFLKCIDDDREVIEVELIPGFLD